MGIYKDNFKFYLNLGLIPYPASKRNKTPVIRWKKDFPNPTTNDYLRWEREYPDANIWVKLGKEFAVIDPDGPSAEYFVLALNLPRCPTSISGSKSIHRWFKVQSPVKPIKATVCGSGLEIRTGDIGMLVAPSIHPETGRAYKWKDGFSPRDIPFPILPTEVYEKIKSLIPKPTFKDEPEKTRYVNAGGSSLLDVSTYLTHYNVRFRIKEDVGRTIYLLERCLFADDHTTRDVAGDSSIIQGDEGKLVYQCFHSHCSNKTWLDARHMISGNEGLARFCSGMVSYPKIRNRSKERGQKNLMGTSTTMANRVNGDEDDMEKLTDIY